MSLEDAASADRRGDIELAAALYEQALVSNESSLASLLDLAILYWQATDPGMAAAKELSPSFLETASRRFHELLAEAERRYPSSTEPRFWRKYIAWADLGEPFDISECRQLLQENPAELIPAMRIFAVTEGKEARREALTLLRACEQVGTTRARYISSVIKAVLRRAG